MYWMRRAAAISGTKHSNAPVVTTSVDNISFTNPIALGNVVCILRGKSNKSVQQQYGLFYKRLGRRSY